MVYATHRLLPEMASDGPAPNPAGGSPMAMRVSLAPAAVPRTMNSPSPSFGARMYAIQRPSFESAGERMPFHDSRSSIESGRLPPVTAGCAAGLATVCATRGPATMATATSTDATPDRACVGQRNMANSKSVMARRAGGTRAPAICARNRVGTTSVRSPTQRRQPIRIPPVTGRASPPTYTSGAQRRLRIPYREKTAPCGSAVPA